LADPRHLSGTIVLITLLALAPAIFCFLTSMPPGSSIADINTRSIYGLHGKYIIFRAAAFIPAAWVFTEYLRTYLFTGFPWSLLAYSQTLNPSFIQIADVTGAYGISFLIVLFNVGVYMAAKRISKSLYLLIAISIIFALVLIYGQYKMRLTFPAMNKLKVAIVQGNIPQEKKWDPRYRNFIIDRYEALTEKAALEDPDLIIWPETSIPGYFEDEQDIKDRLTDLAIEADAFFLFGTLRQKKEKVYNSAILLSAQGKALGKYDKIHLVPFGEYVPLRFLSGGLRELIDKPIGDFGGGNRFKVFKFRLSNTINQGGQIQKTTEFYNFSALICFEDIFPDMSRRFVKQGARFLVNITNDAWFGKSAAPFQHAQGSIFRAVENKVPVIRAANTGVSCVIDHCGRVVAIVKQGKEAIAVKGYINSAISLPAIKTIYTRLGDLFAWFCILVTFFGIANFYLKTRKI